MTGEIPGSTWRSVAREVQGHPIKVWYRSTFKIEPEDSGDDRPGHYVKSFVEIDLTHLRNLIPVVVRSNMPPNSCEADTVILGHSEVMEGAVYRHITNIRTDVSVCTRGPCFPNLLEECTTRNDLGHVHSAMNVRLSARLDGTKLTLRTDNDLDPGRKPGSIQILQALEQVWNFLTLNLTRTAYAAQYDKFLADAVMEALGTSGDLISQQLVVPGMGAYDVKIENVDLKMVPDHQGTQRLRLGVNGSALVPYAAVCEVRKKLEAAAGFHTGR